MRQKVFGIPLIVIVTILLIPTIVLGVSLYTKTMPATITVLAPPGLTIYADAECTNELTKFTFGTIRVGEPEGSYIDLYVKNTGTLPFSDITVTTDLSTGYATMSCPAIGGLVVDEVVGPLALGFQPVGATNSSQSFNIYFECEG